MVSPIKSSQQASRQRLATFAARRVRLLECLANPAVEKVLSVIIPQALWFPAVRRNKLVLFLISAGIIVGMWLERYVFTVASLEHNYMPSYWGRFYPTVWDWAALAGTIGLFLTVFFLLVRFVPIVAMAEVRETIEEKSP